MVKGANLYEIILSSVFLLLSAWTQLEESRRISFLSSFIFFLQGSNPIHHPPLRKNAKENGDGRLCKKDGF